MLLRDIFQLPEHADPGRRAWIVVGARHAEAMLAGPAGPLGRRRLLATPPSADPPPGRVVLELRVRPDLRHPRHVHVARVWAGAIADPLRETLPRVLDEVALGGLQRCTAVTVNALLDHWGMPGILLTDVPETDIGVLAILTKNGLAYRPDPAAAGQTVQQFVGRHQLGAWYVVTPGHAMAVVDGELYDAEQRGADGRKLISAMAITRR